MARARNIKPSFFTNPDLAEMPDKARLLFIGIWMLCDREGKMLWDVRRVRAEVFPYEVQIDCTVLVSYLHRTGMVRLYSVNGTAYLWVPNFTKHQSPHVNEKSSGFPDYSDTYDIAPEQHRTSTVPIHRNEESGMRNHESGIMKDEVSVQAPPTPSQVVSISKSNPSKKAKRNASTKQHLTDYLGGDTKIPPTFWDYAAGEGFDGATIDRLWRNFTRYWGGPDAKGGGLKSDWYGTWCNNVDSRSANGSARQRGAQPPVNGVGQDSKFLAIAGAVVAEQLARNGQNVGKGTPGRVPPGGGEGDD